MRLIISSLLSLEGGNHAKIKQEFLISGLRAFVNIRRNFNMETSKACLIRYKIPLNSPYKRGKLISPPLQKRAVKVLPFFKKKGG